MTCFIVTFDASTPEAVRRITSAIQEYEDNCQLTSSCWALVTSEKAADVRDTLKKALASGDRLFVLRSGAAGAWTNAISKAHSEWLKENL